LKPDRIVVPIAEAMDNLTRKRSIDGMMWEILSILVTH